MRLVFEKVNKVGVSISRWSNGPGLSIGQRGN